MKPKNQTRGEMKSFLHITTVQIINFRKCGKFFLLVKHEIVRYCISKCNLPTVQVLSAVFRITGSQVA